MLINRNRWLTRCVGSLILATFCLTSQQSDAGYLTLSADSNIISGLNGTDTVPMTAGNATFFQNLLGGGQTVKVLSTTFGNNVDGFNQNSIVNTFYNSLAGVTSSIVTGPISTALLAGTNLFIDDLPDAALTTTEVAALRSFLAGGGSVLFLGEGNFFAPDRNSYINANLTALGSRMRLGTDSLEAGSQTASGSQIVANPLTAGVTSFGYAFTNSITGGSSLFLNTNLATTFVATELQPASVPEPGSLTLITIALVTTAAVTRQRSRRTAPTHRS